MAQPSEHDARPFASNSIVAARRDTNRVASSRTQSLHRLQQRVAAYTELAERIEVDGEYAFGTLEQARFTSSFSEMFEIAVGDVALPANERNPLTSAWDDALPRHTRGWRGNSLAFDSVAVLVSSAALFPTVNQSSLLVALDRLTRTLHAMNFAVSGLPGILFLPVHERLLTHVRHDHGKYFSAVLLSLGLNPTQVAIEIPPVFALQPGLLAFIATNYRRHGFKVAVQLPSAALLPEIVMLSAFDYIVPDIDDDTPVRRLAPLVQQAHDNGVTVVLNSPTSLPSDVQRVIAEGLQSARAR